MSLIEKAVSDMSCMEIVCNALKVWKYKEKRDGNKYKNKGFEDSVLIKLAEIMISYLGHDNNSNKQIYISENIPARCIPEDSCFNNRVKYDLFVTEKQNDGIEKIQEIAEIKVRGKNDELGNVSKNKKEVTNIIGDICKICFYEYKGYKTNICNKYMIVCKVIEQEQNENIGNIASNLEEKINNVLGAKKRKKSLVNHEIEKVESKTERGKLYVFKNCNLKVEKIVHKPIAFYSNLVCYLILFKINMK